MSPLHDFDSPSLSSSLPGWQHQPQSQCRPSSNPPSFTAIPHLPSHNIKPGRRRLGLSRYTAPSVTWLLVLFVLVTLCGISEAGIDPGEPEPSWELADLARRGGILFDTRPEPIPRIYARQNGGDLFDGSSTATPVSTTVSIQTSFSNFASPKSSSPSTTTKPASSASSPLMTPSSAPTTYPLPKPFDTSLSSNFTSSSCPDFFSSFLNDPNFISCLPLSLLLQNSNSFFLAEKSVTRITQTLDATCKVDFPTCSALMSSFAVQLRSTAACGDDYTNENALVLQAYNGFLAYQPLYQAGCLKDNMGNYCFANAITNTSSPSDSYVYFLPLGIQLPGASRPTCSSCLQQTMGIFAGAASNLTQPVSTDYVSAAQQIDTGCGPTFVNTSITPIQGSAPQGSGAEVSNTIGMAAWVVLAAMGAFVIWS